MNYGSRMIVLAQPRRVAAAQSLADGLAEALSGQRTLTVESVTANEIDIDVLGSFDAALLVAAADEIDATWRNAIDAIDDAEVPALAVIDGAIEQGSPLLVSRALIVSASLRLPEIAARLEGILHQQRTIKRLKAELSVAQRFQGGLRGEISRMHDEMQLAAMVQQELLPCEMPSLHGVSFSALWRPANYVSGDIYDVTRLDEDHVGVFVVDAVGHGVPAALMTMVIARALPMKEVEENCYRIVSPAEALSRLNREMILRQGETTRFATAVYAIVNCRTRTARIAGAGHPPPLLLRKGDAATEVRTHGGLLGVFADETFDEVQIELLDDDIILFYSDGFEIAFPEDQAAGRSRKLPTKRYLEEFERLAGLRTSQDMIIEIGSRLDAQPGSLHQVDDLTLICLQAGARDVTRPRSDTYQSSLVPAGER